MQDSETETPERPEPQQGLDCFLTDARPCGASCMAYVVHVANPPPALTLQQSHCLLIISAERVGRYLGGLVHIAQKQPPPPPPNPRGKV